MTRKITLLVAAVVLCQTPSPQLSIPQIKAKRRLRSENMAEPMDSSRRDELRAFARNLLQIPLAETPGRVIIECLDEIDRLQQLTYDVYEPQYTDKARAEDREGQ